MGDKEKLGILQKDFIAEGFRLYLKANRKAPANDVLETMYYTLYYTQQMDELTRSLFLTKSLLPEDIFNQYKHDQHIQHALKEAKSVLKSVINDDRKLIRERWQLALKKAWQQLSYENREKRRQILTKVRPDLQVSNDKAPKF